MYRGRAQPKGVEYQRRGSGHLEAQEPGVAALVLGTHCSCQCWEEVLQHRTMVLQEDLSPLKSSLRQRGKGRSGWIRSWVVKGRDRETLQARDRAPFPSTSPSAPGLDWAAPG